VPDIEYRNLRIAWSVGWGVVAVLLCVLWARSYWRSETIRRVASTTIYTSITSDRGAITLIRNDKLYFLSLSLQFAAKDDWQYSSRTASKLTPSFGYRSAPGDIYLRTPFWAIVLGFAALASGPWIGLLSWRFSLRTLLIATTLVAVGLGVAVYTLRQ
jgi:hypothetical protein